MDDDDVFICPLTKEACIRAFCEDYGCADEAGVPLDANDFAAGSLDPDEIAPRLPRPSRAKAGGAA